MRLNSLEDAAREIDLLRNRIDAMAVGDIDAQQRRIINLRPSKDPGDAVTRRELMQIVPAQQPQERVVASTPVGLGVFGVAVQGTLSAGYNLCPPHIIQRSAEISKVYVSFEREPVGSTTTITIRSEDPYPDGIPTGDEKIVFRAEIPEQTDFTESFEVPLTEEEGYEYATWEYGLTLEAGKTLTIDVDTVASTDPGGGMIVKIIY